MKGDVVCGVDIGSWTFKICAYNGNTFDILTNQANFRETPSLVGFKHKERMVGQEAHNKLKSNYMNTVRAPMRLIGLDDDFHRIQEELKNATSEYQIEEELQFFIHGESSRKITIFPEQLLISLMAKIKKIIESHQYSAKALFIAVPSFLSHYQRKVIKKCAEIAEVASQIRLVDDWVCIATEYSFHRVSQLNNNNHSRTVAFIDIGYSKLSLFVMSFTNNECRLLDCEHLRFLGSKNMNHLLAQFYDQMFKKQSQKQHSIFSIGKSYVKLADQIESQRKVLSANSQHHMQAQALVQDYDLSFTMKRQHFEQIIGPVVQKIQKAIVNIKSRMPSHFKIHSVELLGGTTRTPLLKKVVEESFSLVSSKTLNQSEAIANGATVYGAIQKKLLSYSYSVPDINLLDIWVSWNFIKNDELFGEDPQRYEHKQLLFKAYSHVPSEQRLVFGYQGPVEMYIYYGQFSSKNTVGYLRFSTPSEVMFAIDSNKIVSAWLVNAKFQLSKMQDKKEEKWQKIRQWSKEAEMNEELVRRIYQLKNQYQASLYKFKNKVEEYTDYMSVQQLVSITSQLQQIQEWIQKENTRPVGSQQDLILYQQKNKQILGYMHSFQVLQKRKAKAHGLIQKHQQLKVLLQHNHQKANTQQKHKLQLLDTWAAEMYQKMRETQWQGYYLTHASLDFALNEADNILKKIN